LGKRVNGVDVPGLARKAMIAFLFTALSFFPLPPPCSFAFAMQIVYC
jgi:hypothetical protein